ncbi:PhzF family phenazine biosynthesis protein [Aminipila sp.]|uniref:PhzF family phenazine biosynthesis protein n=1 Tax=Aminipila sp. TaxID=2060095 RepID=UPI0028989D19|nr:PhzF family phenazine biosynthesis protein [Aminipila sp.]
MKFQIIDAFSDEVFGGNPAGVVLLEDGQGFPSDEVMLKTAAELRYSETAFIKKIGDKTFHIRYFTPAAEVDLCGHATIGSFGAMLEWSIIEDNQNYTLETLAGFLNVQINDGFIFMDMSEPIRIATIENEQKKAELAVIMGLKPEDILMNPDIVSTGLPDIMMGVRSKKLLNAINPDFEALSKLSQAYEVTGVHAFSLGEDGSGITADCRNFAPLYDIDEEAATGTSNGALTFYLFEKGMIQPEERNLFIQGEAMNRPSKVMSKLTIADGRPKIQVGGVYKKLAEGEIYI